MTESIEYLPPLGYSDHCCLLIDMILYTRDKEEHDDIKFRYDKANYRKIENGLNEIDWVSILGEKKTGEAFTDIFENSMKKHILTYKPGKDKRRNMYIYLYQSESIEKSQNEIQKK